MKFCEAADGLLPGKMHSVISEGTKFARCRQRGAEGVPPQGSQHWVGLDGAPKDYQLERFRSTDEAHGPSQGIVSFCGVGKRRGCHLLRDFI